MQSRIVEDYLLLQQQNSVLQREVNRLEEDQLALNYAIAFLEERTDAARKEFEVLTAHQFENEIDSSVKLNESRELKALLAKQYYGKLKKSKHQSVRLLVEQFERSVARIKELEQQPDQTVRLPPRTQFLQQQIFLCKQPMAKRQQVKLMCVGKEGELFKDERLLIRFSHAKNFRLSLWNIWNSSLNLEIQVDQTTTKGCLNSDHTFTFEMPYKTGSSIRDFYRVVVRYALPFETNSRTETILVPSFCTQFKPTIKDFRLRERTYSLDFVWDYQTFGPFARVSQRHPEFSPARDSMRFCLKVGLQEFYGAVLACREQESFAVELEGNCQQAASLAHFIFSV